MSETKNVLVAEDVVVKFVGDSGDGMQLTGTLFSDTVAYDHNDLTTFPDYPAEIRAPQNTIAGVSGFQVHFGSKKILTFGDLCQTLVAMNPASLKANLKWAEKGAYIIVDADLFTDAYNEKAGYKTNPLTDGSLSEYKLAAVPMISLTKEAVKHLEMDNKSVIKSKNMFSLGICLYLYSKTLDHAIKHIDSKFAKKPQLAELNKTVLKAGYEYAEKSPIFDTIFQVNAADVEKGNYRNIHGNQATAWGLIAAAEKAKLQLFLGSYPITPATEILMELAKHKSLGVKVIQYEDEIAGICGAIGASFAGSLACTTTSGPGLSLKSEAMGLAVITELPLVIVNVQRGGPSTGLPTKSEQSDLMQALFGRNGEAPMVVISSSSPVDCFYKAFFAAKIALEHMVPVILLTEGALGFGSELFRIPKMSELPEINPPMATPNDPDFKPYRRDPETLVRQWATPGTEGLRHRIGGLEKEDIIGNVSTDPLNHEKMTYYRAEKVARVVKKIPDQELYGDATGDLLIVSWGSTQGSVYSAVRKLREDGYKVSQAHFSYLNPLPKNTEEVLSGFKHICVCELNSGQLVNWLKMNFNKHDYSQYNKVQGLPFLKSELLAHFTNLLKK
ncbi:MAG: 2-oxoacid:acceptor oxidoreductase subunit alpha [Bacteroidetes bacterium HGW-Bacteroidetes-21]|nr:MAG: 2-oxoacid:acceptor oxidoreductase subunit alpha [Bacteroidetes bacterium HGW-Bacteroidetes-21]